MIDNYSITDFQKFKSAMFNKAVPYIPNEFLQHRKTGKMAKRGKRVDKQVQQ